MNKWIENADGEVFDFNRIEAITCDDDFRDCYFWVSGQRHFFLVNEGIDKEDIPSKIIQYVLNSRDELIRYQSIINWINFSPKKVPGYYLDDDEDVATNWQWHNSCDEVPK